MVNCDLKILFMIGMSEDSKFAYEICKLSIERSVPNSVVRPTLVSAPSKYINGNRATNFSFNRLFIPCSADFSDYDYVLYMDSDQLLLKDLTRLLTNLEITNGFATVKFAFDYSQSSVIVWQPAKFNKYQYIEELEKLDLQALNVDEAILKLGARETLPDILNSLDWITNDTLIVHFTYMPTQPWVNIRSILYPFYKSFAIELIQNCNVSVASELSDTYSQGVKKGFIHPKFFGENDFNSLGWTKVRHRNLIFVPYWIKNNHRLRSNIFMKTIIKILTFFRIL